MTNLKTNTARAALIALMATAPMAAFASPESGSPQQPVAQDPDEKVEADSVYSTGGADQVVDTPKADQGVNSDETADVERELDAESYNDPAKSDS